MNSIYIESEKIRERKDIIEWLDGCGATIKHLKNIVENTYIIFGVSKANGIKYWKYNTFLTEAQKEDSTHCQTPEQFCELIAECLGIDKPVFGELLSNTGKVIEGIPMRVATVDYNIPSQPIKGMAIEVSRLSEEDKEELELVRKKEIENGIRECRLFWDSWAWITYSDSSLVLSGAPFSDLTITDSPKVFMEYVAQQTGEEYNRAYSSEELMDLPESEIEKLRRIGNPSYPHKTYRILDSLDSIPLDTRFKLSEWIPPVGQKVLLITKDWFLIGYFDRIESKIIFETGQGVKALNLDGEWMRVV